MTTDRAAMVLLAAESSARGFRNALSFRRWCKRNGVAIYKTGRMESVATAEVDAALRGPVVAPQSLAALAAASASRTMPPQWQDRARASGSFSMASSAPVSASARSVGRGR